MTDSRKWFIAATSLILLTGLADAQTPYLISTYAGGLAGPTANVATSYPIQNPNGLATDQFGNTYVSTASHCVFRLDPNSYFSRVAGTCHAGFSGDGGYAVEAGLNNPQGLAVDGLGNLYISDSGNQRVRRVTPDGMISTVAGNGSAGFTGDNGPATRAQLNFPKGLAVDAAGNLYIADQQNEVIRRVTPSGMISTFAGQLQYPGKFGDGGPATSATLDFPYSVAVDSVGNVYIGDGSYQVRKVNSGGIITHVAGTGLSGPGGDSGPAAVAQLSIPAGLAFDLAGNLYIADEINQLIRRIDISGIITTFAGGGGSLGDGGSAINAELYRPMGVAVDTNGNVYIADQENRVRKVTPPGGIITTAAGNGSFPFGGDGGRGSLALFSGNWGLANGGTAGLYVADTNNYRVRQISPAGIVSTVAGNGANTDSGDGGMAADAGVTPDVVAVDGLGNVYLADFAIVRKVTTGGVISTVAGTGVSGYTGDGGQATAAQLSGYIFGLAVDPNGNVYISDWDSNRIRKVTPGGTISTVVGTGAVGPLGDNGPATSAGLNNPAALAFDTNGNLYIADYNNSRIRMVTAANGTITTVAGNGSTSSSGDGQAATSAGIGYPYGVAVDGSGNLFIATTYLPSGSSIREVSPAGIISTIAGSGTLSGYTGDGGPATAALLNNPKSIIVGSNGNLYISDSNNGAIRVLQPETEPLLTVSSTHGGNFTAGQQEVTFIVTVSDAPLAAATSGAVTVTDIQPVGVTPISMGGAGWSCSYTFPTFTCQNAGSVSGGNSYAPLMMVADVASFAPPQIDNQVTVSGGGSLGGGSSDLVFIAPPSPTLGVSTTHVGNFVAGEPATFTIYVGNEASASATNGTVTVTDTLPSGLSLVLMAGNGWNCTGATCTNSTPLAGGASYSPITGTVNVASNATTPETNQVTVSGGGSASASDSDPITVLQLACQITGGASATVVDVQAAINQALGLSPAVNDLNKDGVINSVDAQIVINAVLTLNCTL